MPPKGGSLTRGTEPTRWGRPSRHQAPASGSAQGRRPTPPRPTTLGLARDRRRHSGSGWVNQTRRQEPAHRPRQAAQAGAELGLRCLSKHPELYVDPEAQSPRPQSSVLAREGAGCGSVGDVTGAWLASPFSKASQGELNQIFTLLSIESHVLLVITCSHPFSAAVPTGQGTTRPMAPVMWNKVILEDCVNTGKSLSVFCCPRDCGTRDRPRPLP